ncbi:MAG TPA: hypothetical protein VLU73_18890 [Methylococcaceae bacterium]|jgi:hypothetical protein|nr:hypothetical protein [Methylococcaceae bacterium]
MRQIATFLFGALIVPLMLSTSTVWAYGGGGGGGGGAPCQEPQFFLESPTDSAVPALSEFSLTISGNTEIETLTLEVNGQKATPVLTQQRNGDWLATVRLPQPITQSGKVRIGVSAKSKEGCSGFKPYYVEVKPG